MRNKGNVRGERSIMRGEERDSCAAASAPAGHPGDGLGILHVTSDS